MEERIVPREIKEVLKKMNSYKEMKIGSYFCEEVFLLNKCALIYTPDYTGKINYNTSYYFVIEMDFIDEICYVAIPKIKGTTISKEVLNENINFLIEFFTHSDAVDKLVFNIEKDYYDEFIENTKDKASNVIKGELDLNIRDYKANKNKINVLIELESDKHFKRYQEFNEMYLKIKHNFKINVCEYMILDLADDRWSFYINYETFDGMFTINLYEIDNRKFRFHPIMINEQETRTFGTLYELINFTVEFFKDMYEKNKIRNMFIK